jgi:hypothetical protein
LQQPVIHRSGAARACWRAIIAVWRGHLVALKSSTLTPPSWTSKMKCGAGSSLQ